MGRDSEAFHSAKEATVPAPGPGARKAASIFRRRGSEKACDQFAHFLQATKMSQQGLAELSRRIDLLVPDAIVFYIVTHILVGIAFRIVGREKEELKLAVMCIHESVDAFGFVGRMTVNDQKDRARRVDQKTVKKLNEHLGIDPRRAQHEAKVTPGAYGREDVRSKEIA